MKVYNLLIYIAKILILPILSFFNKKIKLTLKEHKITNNFLKSYKKNNYKTVWFHVASAGEFLQASSLISLFIENNYNIVVSYTSISCKSWLEKHNIKNFFIFPLDTKENIKKIINTIKPISLILTRYDLWPNLINETYNNKIPIFLISATLNLKKLRYLKKFYKNLYSKIKIIFTVDEEETNKFNKIKITNTISSIDTKYNYVLKRINTSINNELATTLNNLKSNFRKIISLGSSWPKDEKIVIPAFKKLLYKENNLLLILAPHELERLDKIKKALVKHDLNFCLYSKLSNNYNYNVILVDKIGILLDFYRISDFAFIGSGSGGVHNILEAYYFNIPISFRNTYFNSKEASFLLSKKQAKVVENKDSFIDFINTSKKNTKLYFTENKINFIYNKIINSI